MTNPIDQIVFQQFNQFYATCKSASQEKSPEKREVLVNALFRQQEELLGNAKSAKSLPRALTGQTHTLKTLSEELSAKIISLLSANDVEKNSGSDSSSSNSQKISLTGPGFGPKKIYLNECVGFGNKNDGYRGKGNCWANVLLQMFLSAPHLLQILNTVGNFYAKGNTPDSVRMKKIIELFGPSSLPASAREKGIALFNQITSDYWKLKTLEALIQSGKPALASLLLNSISNESSLKQRWTKLRTEQSVNNTLNILIKNEEGREKSKHDNLKKAGQYLLDAIQQYHLCRTAPNRGEQPRYVHENVSQNVRIALHYLSEGRISPAASDYEDAFDALGIFTGCYQEIEQLYDRTPPGYFQLEERIRFAPKNKQNGDPDLRLISNINRTALAPGNMLNNKTSYDHQILLHAPTSRHDATVEDLLAACFESDEQGDSVYFLHQPDGIHPDKIHEQAFEPNHVRRKFIGQEAPPALNLVISRGGQRPLTLQLYKILSRVIASRVMTLPANATDKNVPLAYELISFFVHQGTHGGGHYIAYRKTGEQWVECDDDKLRTVSNEAIDAILRCRTTSETHTPYVLNYRLVPPAKQAEMLQLSQTLRQVDPLPEEQPPAPPPPKTDPASKNASLKTQQQLVDQLEQLQKLLQGTASNEEIRKTLDAINKTSNTAYNTVFDMIGISEGMKDAHYVRNLLLKNPRNLLKITGSWFRSSSGNIIDQLLQYEKEKLAILKLDAAEKPDSAKLIKQKKQYVTQNLMAFLALLQDNECTDKQQLIAAFNTLFIPKNIRDNLFERLEKAHGREKGLGKEIFEKEPWLLLGSAKETPLLNDKTEDLWGQFDDMFLEPRTHSILEEVIEQLQK